GTATDTVSSYSNSASFLSLLAPGRWINSSVPGGAYANFSGTSMAAPHVAGAWAILRQRNPNKTVTEILNALTSTGVSVTDTRNNITKKRIKLDQAVSALYGCTYSISPISRSVTASAGSGTISVTTQNGCWWNTGSSSQSWLTATSDDSILGSGTVNYNFTANSSTTLSRTATVIIAGQTFTLRQAAAGSATFTVTRADDRYNTTCVAGDCSLREAVRAAETAPTADTIVIREDVGNIVLTSEIVINAAGTLTIKDEGGGGVKRIHGSNVYNSSSPASRIFYINGETVTLSNLSLGYANGSGALNSGSGGAIYANGGSLALKFVEFERNTASNSGGAIYASGGSLIFDSVRFNGNNATSTGGAVTIFSGGSHRIINSTFEANYSGSCGAIAAFGANTGGTIAGRVTMANTTVSGNKANGVAEGGGGVCNSATMIVRNSTITDNAARNDRLGGGIRNYEGAHLDIGNSIVAGNRATSRPEILNLGVVSSAGNNLIGDSTGDAVNTTNAITYQTTDKRDQDPMLIALTYTYNEPDFTQTHVLRTGSPAIDAGDNAKAVDPFDNSPLTTDQRNSQRKADGDNNNSEIVDIGAYEVRKAPAAKEFIVNLTTDAPDANHLDSVCDTNLSVSGLQCSLRAAVSEAEYYAGNDRISFDLPANSTIALNDVLYIYANGTLVIAGMSANNLTINLGGILSNTNLILYGVDLTISGLTLTNGKRAIESSYSALTLNEVNFTSNGTTTGGDTLFLQYTTARILNSNVSSNRGSSCAAVFAADFGRFEMVNTTVSNNGGGLCISNMDTTIRNSTIAGNTTNTAHRAGGISYS
ncbi:MAG TPA: choice-of-anchor Q domain-containing protein, partial [Pyrinomonadaceae bacterium]|nr:choice-of-anchor Q domain-containing protein [Pyrinomonadaceae bacterium]